MSLLVLPFLTGCKEAPPHPCLKEKIRENEKAKSQKIVVDYYIYGNGRQLPLRSDSETLFIADPNLESNITVQLNEHFDETAISFEQGETFESPDLCEGTPDDFFPNLKRIRSSAHYEIHLCQTDYFLPEILSDGSIHLVKGITPVGFGMSLVDSWFALDGIATHEVGHGLGLFHTFETRFGIERIDGENSRTAGDLIQDTPADPGNGKDGCRVNYQAETLEEVLECETDQMGQHFKPLAENWMSYYFSDLPERFSSALGFTSDQTDVMQCVWSQESDRFRED